MTCNGLNSEPYDRVVFGVICVASLTSKFIDWR